MTKIKKTCGNVKTYGFKILRVYGRNKIIFNFFNKIVYNYI